MKFIDLARQMEAFFIQKRFLLSALRPELVLKEENLDLRMEIQRKDELIKKHYERIENWKKTLSENQHAMTQNAPLPGSTGTLHCGPVMTGPTNMPGISGNMPGINMPQSTHIAKPIQVHSKL